MTCPYSDPKCAGNVPAGTQRCQCRRYVKRCSPCATRNRAFANFCRTCGAALPPSTTNWSAGKGGPRRLGLNAAPLGSDFTAHPPSLQLQLGDPCLTILGYDGHLIAVSKQGVVEVADPLQAKSLCRFQVQGPVTAEPCIKDGVLYVGTRNQLCAYSLAAMSLATPRVSQLWHFPLNGPAIHALTVAGDRLFVTIASAGRQEVQVVENVARQPSSPRPLLGGGKLSWVAADPANARAVVLSESDGHGLQLHVVAQQVVSHRVQLDELADHAIALLGGTIFGIFGDSRRLYRIDAESGAVVEPLESDTQHFALSRAGDDWDRDGVHVDTRGVGFMRSGVRDLLATHERITKGSSLIVQGSAAIVGMEDGRVRIYNFAHAPRHETWSVGGNGGEITALAAFESHIAAGTSQGVVEVRELRANGARQ